MTTYSTIAAALIALFTLLLVAMPACAQALLYGSDWWTLDSGGAVVDSAGAHLLSATVGQPDAAPVSYAGDYAISFGYWPGDIQATDNQAQGQTSRVITYGDLARLASIGVLIVSWGARAWAAS